MKKFLLAFLSVVLIFTFVGCAPLGTPSRDPSDTDTDSPVEEDEGLFTVSLVYNGEPFITYEDISAIWTANDGTGMFNAPFDRKTGKASTSGLDGIYKVTLSKTPSGYAYDPNGYFVTNSDRKKEIELFKILATPVGRTGTDFYEDVITLNAEGVYRFNFTKSGSQRIYCQFSPKNSGAYYIESLADITANEINPRIDIYEGSFAFKNPVPKERVDTVPEDADFPAPPRSVYTKNFRCRYTGGSNSYFPFVLRIDSTVGVPATLDLRIYKDPNSSGSIEKPQEYKLVDIDPTVTLEQMPDETGTYTMLTKQIGNKLLFDSSLYGLGNDGYYYVKAEDGTLTDKRIYAKLTQPNFIIDFSHIDAIEGEHARLRFRGKDYTFLIRGYNGLVKRGIYDEAILAKYENAKSYCDFVNKDGAYAVTPQLAEFFREFSNASYYFHDGDGYLEHEGYASSDADQWLFACGYYA